MENNFEDLSNSFHCIFETLSNTTNEESFKIEKDIFMDIKNENQPEIKFLNINHKNLNKKRKKFLNEEEKQKEKRRKNKEAAKKSRDKKRKEFQFLFEENIKLKKEIEYYKKIIAINLCENCANKFLLI